ncbi:HAD family hydrolase, partial [Aminobacterium sp. UBA5277]
SEIRSKYFQGRPVPLLEGMAMFSEKEKSELWHDIYELEMNGAEQATPVQYAMDFVEWLNQKSIPWVVVSRNCGDSIRLAAKKINFPLPDKVFCRDAGPVKPDPKALWLAAKELNLEAQQCAMVGDYVYDLVGARRAGMRALLVQRPQAEWRHWADAVFPTMKDLLEALQSPLPLIPWEYTSLVEQKGERWLIKAWLLSLQIPDDAPDIGSLCEEAARLGAGSLVISPSVSLSPAQWKNWPGLSPVYLGMEQGAVIREVLKKRFPLISIREGTDGVLLSGVPHLVEREMEALLK